MVDHAEGQLSGCLNICSALLRLLGHPFQDDIQFNACSLTKPHESTKSLMQFDLHIGACLIVGTLTGSMRRDMALEAQYKRESIIVTGDFKGAACS